MLSDRILPLHSKHYFSGNTVMYVMARDQRVYDNHALLAAQQKALELRVPLLVLFNLYPNVAHRAHQHYQFMLKGLEEVAETLEMQGIAFHLAVGNPVEKYY